MHVKSSRPCNLNTSEFKFCHHCRPKHLCHTVRQSPNQTHHGADQKKGAKIRQRPDICAPAIGCKEAPSLPAWHPRPDGHPKVPTGSRPPHQEITIPATREGNFAALQRVSMAEPCHSRNARGCRGVHCRIVRGESVTANPHICDVEMICGLMDCNDSLHMPCAGHKLLCIACQACNNHA